MHKKGETNKYINMYMYGILLSATTVARKKVGDIVLVAVQAHDPRPFSLPPISLAGQLPLRELIPNDKR